MTEDVAVMVSVDGMVMADHSDIEPERNSIHTLVAVKRDTEWSFAAFQKSPISAGPKSIEHSQSFECIIFL